MITDLTERMAVIERLAQHQLLHAAPRAELEWLAAHGEMRALQQGEFLARTGDRRESHHLYVMLSGRITTYVQLGGVRRKIRETRGGELAGLLPFSRRTHSTADIVVDDPVEMLHID